MFCAIVEGNEPSEKIWENQSFLAIKNKYPSSPVHLLVLPKQHVGKEKLVADGDAEFWGEMMTATFAVVKQAKLDKTGYKLVNNGAGYNHFDHEHIHVLGGSKGEPRE